MPKKPFQGGSNISTSFFTRNVPRGNLCLALITVRRSDVEHSLILDDNVFPLLAAWITSHQKRLESGPWLDIKLSHDMGWAWDTRPLVELLTHTQFEVYEVNNWTMNSITGNNKIGVKPWEFAFQEFLEEHKRRFLEFGATLHECSIPTHYNLQLKYFLP